MPVQRQLHTQRRQRRVKIAWAAIVTELIADAIFLLTLAWVIMLLLGGLHREVSGYIPAFGFGAVFLILVSGRLLFNLLRNGLK